MISWVNEKGSGEGMTWVRVEEQATQNKIVVKKLLR